MRGAQVPGRQRAVEVGLHHQRADPHRDRQAVGVGGAPLPQLHRRTGDPAHRLGQGDGGGAVPLQQRVVVRGDGRVEGRGGGRGLGGEAPGCSPLGDHLGQPADRGGAGAHRGEDQEHRLVQEQSHGGRGRQGHAGGQQPGGPARRRGGLAGYLDGPRRGGQGWARRAQDLAAADVGRFGCRGARVQRQQAGAELHGGRGDEQAPVRPAARQGLHVDASVLSQHQPHVVGLEVGVIGAQLAGGGPPDEVRPGDQHGLLAGIGAGHPGGGDGVHAGEWAAATPIRQPGDEKTAQ
ncbi:MAG: hypothetical protein V9E89_08175 [Ilumatobacteraceae bacterium]